MTKDTDEFSQFTEPVACCEYTLPRDEKSTDPKGWIRGNTKIGPVLGVTTRNLQGKYGVEIRIKSVNKDNSHSWVSISHGLNKLVTDLSNKEDDDNEQETSEMQFEDCALKTDVFASASRSKAKAKPRRPTSVCSSTNTVLIRQRLWIALEPGTQFDQAYPVAKRLNTLLRHGQLPREEDGAIEFWRLKDYLRNEFENSRHWSDEMWKSKMAGGGGNKKIFQYCTDSSGQDILYLRALQGHSGRNLIDPSSQDNVLIPDTFFEDISHIGCAINLHSITNSGFISGRQNSSRERQTVFFTVVNLMNKNHKDPQELDLTKPRLAWYKQKTWKRHQDPVFWVDIQLAQRKRLKFYQTRCNAIIFDDTLPAYCISKVVVMESGEILYEKVYVSLRPPPTISFKDNWTCDLDSEVAGGNADSLQNQPKSKTKQLSRTLRLVSEQQLTQEIEKDILFGQEDIKHSRRTGRPVDIHPKLRVSMPVKIEEEDQTRTVRPVTVDELDIDFRVPGLSHAEFKSSSKRSKVIVIEKHFKPTCSRLTSTTHSATIRRRWSADWAM